jgi:hypothetical protein
VAYSLTDLLLFSVFILLKRVVVVLIVSVAVTRICTEPVYSRTSTYT